MSILSYLKRKFGKKTPTTKVPPVKINASQVELQIDIVVDGYLDQCLNLLNLNSNTCNYNIMHYIARMIPYNEHELEFLNA